MEMFSQSMTRAWLRNVQVVAFWRFLYSGLDTPIALATSHISGVSTKHGKRRYQLLSCKGVTREERIIVHILVGCPTVEPSCRYAALLNI